jgi:hypothetical protein
MSSAAGDVCVGGRLGPQLVEATEVVSFHPPRDGLWPRYFAHCGFISLQTVKLKAVWMRAECCGDYLKVRTARVKEAKRKQIATE